MRIAGGLRAVLYFLGVRCEISALWGIRVTIQSFLSLTPQWLVTLGPVGDQQGQWSRRMTKRNCLSPFSSSVQLVSSAARSVLPVFRHHAGMSRQVPLSVVKSSNASPRPIRLIALPASITGPGQKQPEMSITSVGWKLSKEDSTSGIFHFPFSQLQCICYCHAELCFRNCKGSI